MKILKILFFFFIATSLHRIAIRGRVRKTKILKIVVFLNFRVSVWARQYNGQREKKTKIFKNCIFSTCLYGIANLKGRAQKTKTLKTALYKFRRV